MIFTAFLKNFAQIEKIYIIQLKTIKNFRNEQTTKGIYNFNC